MIIDNHVHIFPDQAGPAGYKDEAAYRAELQKIVRPSWGRMYSSHEDPKYIAEAGEDVGFRVGRFNRFQWKKHGEDVWLQRGAVSMEKMEYTPDQLIANMDFIGVDKGVVLAGYMEHTWGREVYFADAIREHPDRLIGTVAIEYDVSRDEKYLQGEIEKLTRAVEENGFRALHTHVIKGQPVDDPKCDPCGTSACASAYPCTWTPGSTAVRRTWRRSTTSGTCCRSTPTCTSSTATLGPG